MLPLGFVLIIGGGALAVSLYRRKRGPYIEVAPRDGAKIGALTGLGAYVVFAIIQGLAFLAKPETVRNLISQAIQHAQAQNPDPKLQEIYSKFASPEGMALMMTLIMAMFFIVFIGLSSVGGAIGAAVSRRSSRR
jgi:hypothetical protein